MKPYFLSILAQFKNEAHIFEEWLKHYVNWGVDHFFLMNDNSTDNFEHDKYFQKLLKERKITLISLPFSNKQKENCQKYFPIIKKQTKWLIYCDLDEFIYSPIHSTISKALTKYSEYESVFIFWKIFLTSNCIKQPISVINSNLTSVGYEDYPHFNNFGRGKSIFNMNKLSSITNFHGKNVKKKAIIKNINPDFNLNHYRYQSKEFLINIKGGRGGGVRKTKYKKLMNMLLKSKTNDIDHLLLNTNNLNKCTDLKNLKGLVKPHPDLELKNLSTNLIKSLHS